MWRIEMSRYITVFNKVTKRSVPFFYNAYDEVVINSIRPEDNPDSCYVSITDLFYEYSIDLEQTKKV
jgi:hypothetical protein